MLLLEKNFILIHLVAGGAGFIGSYIVEKLILKGENVICVDNLSSGDFYNVKKWHNHRNFSFIKHDLINPLDMFKVNKIWHFSCPGSPLFYQLDPVKTLNTCFNGTLNLLELAKFNKAKILLASSSEIYGKAEKYPQDENYNGSVNTIGTRSCYSEGKRISESLCYAYCKKFNLEISIARIFNVYGPKMSPNDGRVISSFISNALKKGKIIINGNGKQTRSFCYVDDIVDGLIKLMNSNYSLPINLGNPKEEYSIKDVADFLSRILKSNLYIEFNNQILDEPLRRRPNIEVAKKILNWEPKYSFNYGLRKTIQQFKNDFNL